MDNIRFLADSESTATPLFLILVSSNIISMVIMVLLVAMRCKDKGRSSGILFKCFQTIFESDCFICKTIKLTFILFSPFQQIL